MLCLMLHGGLVHSFQLCLLQGDLCAFMHSLVQGIGLGWLC